MDVSTIETMLGRDLTVSELKTVEWLQGWSRETQESVMMMIISAWQRGFQLGRSRRKGK